MHAYAYIGNILLKFKIQIRKEKYWWGLQWSWPSFKVVLITQESDFWPGIGRVWKSFIEIKDQKLGGTAHGSVVLWIPFILLAVDQSNYIKTRFMIIYKWLYKALFQ